MMMKKQLVLIAFACMASTVAMAQNWSQDLQFGIKGGVNFATVTGDYFDDPDHRTSFNAGLVLEAPIADRISLQPEVFYSGQGFDITDEPDQRDAEFQLDYIQVPVLLKVYVIEGLNIQVGPQFGFKVNEEIDFDPNSDGGDFDTDAIEDFDMQIATGLEYKFQNNFFIQGRYTYGFSDIIKDVDIHNSVFSVNIGYMF